MNGDILGLPSVTVKRKEAQNESANVTSLAYGRRDRFLPSH